MTISKENLKSFITIVVYNTHNGINKVADFREVNGQVLEDISEKLYQYALETFKDETV